MIRPILRHGAPTLHDPAAPVAGVTPELQQLIDDMIETMHAEPGIGIAAPQVGVSQRVCVIDLSVVQRASELLVLVNPRVTERSGWQFQHEGCLSVPGFSVRVPRPRRLVVRALDRNGAECAVEGIGLLARALQHELDHLDGRLYVERLGRLRRWLLLRRVGWLRRKGRW